MTALLRSLSPYLWAHRARFGPGFAMVVASNLLTTITPRFLQAAIDRLGSATTIGPVVRPLALMVAVALAGGACRFWMRQWLNGASRFVEYDLRDAFFAHLTRLSPAFYDRLSVGDLMARATNDLLAMRMVAGPALMYAVDTAVRAAIILPAMLAISPRLTLLALLPLLGLPVAMIALGQRIHARSLAIQEQFAELTRQVHEHLSGVRVVRAYRQEAAEYAHFEALNRDYAARNLALVRVQGAFHPVLALLGGLGGAIALWVGGRQVLEGTVTVGAFVAFGVYLGMLAWPLIAFGWAINLFQRGAAAMQRLREVFDAEPAIASPPPEAAAPLPPHDGARALAFDDVWFRYPGAADRGWVLRGVSFTVGRGESLAIVGATGAGKSTLCELVVRAYDPDRGRILLDGVDLRDLRLEVLRAEVGVVPQETFLFSETLRDNVLLGNPDDGRLARAAAVSQLAAALPDLPRGWDTLLGERGINLSGGQKQRAAIARALAKDPPLFVLDDALSAVDAQTEARILHALRDALRGRTSVLVSHRIAAVREATRILVLEAGVVVEEGTHDELLARDGRYAALARRQQLEAEVEGAA